MISKLIFFLILSTLVKISSSDSINYRCSLCLSVVDDIKRGPDSLSPKEFSFLRACEKVFPSEVCNKAFLSFESSPILKDFEFIYSHSSRDSCERALICPFESFSQDLTANANNVALDIRVSKALGSKGYDKIRLSVVSNTTISSSLFSYTSQFKYRWTSNYLSTGVVSVTPGKTNTFSVNGQSIDVFIPSQGDGVRGVIIADPCFQSQWINCLYKDKFSTFNHTTELLNAINAWDDTHFWQILGDNFYDQTGDPTKSWFMALSQKTKSKVFATTPGNHDFWVKGSPSLYTIADQLGNGFMQFYGQDTISSTVAATDPYDFTNNPDSAEKGSEYIPPASDYFFYNQLGNIAFFGFSGAHDFTSMQSYFNEACTWAESVDPAVILLVGHWNNAGDGCSSNAAVPAVYNELVALPACSKVASRIKFFMGHQHCNKVTLADIGFMVGAQGMSDSSSCGGAYGIPVVDTTNGYFKLYYFPVAQANEFDNYDEILSCIKSKGVSNCYNLATLWASVKL